MRPALVDFHLFPLLEDLLAQFLVKAFLGFADITCLEPLLFVVFECAVQFDLCLAGLHDLLFQLVNLLPEVLLLALLAPLSQTGR